MCGIVGIFSIQDGPPRAEDIRAMAATVVHRGPDDDGFLVDSHAALGFRRLAIIDVDGGSQPTFNEDHSVAVFHNGEIYNFQELRAELAAKGHTFRTCCDTEVIGHLYEDLGERFVERLRGMFAIAVYDRRRHRLILARDRLGKKPLYYAKVGGTVLYASELKAFLALTIFPRAVDEQALLDFFTYRSVPTPKTIFRAARKLPPGHILIVDPEGVHPPRPYWRLSFADPLPDPPEQLAERLAELLAESVQLRLRSDVPLGAFLSGGIDSGAVVAMMAASSSEPVRTFSVGFDDPRHDERAAAHQTARALGTTHVETVVRLDPTVALDVLPWFFDEPFADASAVPTYAVAKIAREQVTVALSGDGGDENFAGYWHHRHAQRAGWIRQAFPPATRPLLRAAATVYPPSRWLPRSLRARGVLSSAAEDPLRAYFGSVWANDPAFVRRCFGGDLRAQLRGYDPLSVLEETHARADAPDPLGKILQTDMATTLVDDFLTKIDRASMAASLEVRCPLLDHRFVEFAARIPSAFKLRHGRSKWIFRRALAGLVPEAVLTRPKHGFDVPLRAWTQQRLRPAIEAAIQEAPPGLYDRTALAKTWREHLAGARDHSEFFWALLVLDRWRRTHGVPLP